MAVIRPQVSRQAQMGKKHLSFFILARAVWLKTILHPVVPTMHYISM